MGHHTPPPPPARIKVGSPPPRVTRMVPYELRQKAHTSIVFLHCACCLSHAVVSWVPSPMLCRRAFAYAGFIVVIFSRQYGVGLWIFQPSCSFAISVYCHVHIFVTSLFLFSWASCETTFPRLLYRYRPFLAFRLEPVTVSVAIFKDGIHCEVFFVTVSKRGSPFYLSFAFCYRDVPTFVAPLT
jgi:hypothetical protein